jgi:hypothetical protein
MGAAMDVAKGVGAGVALTAVADVVFYKAFPHVPFLNNRTILSRGLLSGLALFGAVMTNNKTAQIALMIAAGHNIVDTPLHIEQYHKFLGISGHEIDSVASEAVQAIEDKIDDELKTLKDKFMSGPMSDSPMSARAEEAKDVHYTYE